MDDWRGDGAAQAVEAVEAALSRADESRRLGAFWRLDPEGAVSQAERVQRVADEDLPLAGVPVAVKDLFDVRGLPTTAGLPGDHLPARSDAEVVRRLRAAGAVPIGKTAMDPLGATTGGQAPGFPPCVNPVDDRLSPGGSSSGSAVAVAAGVVPLAIGTDTAGSIRVPAAYTRLAGFKPALNAVPRRGCVSVMPSFDTVGVLARSVSGCVAGYRALAGGKNLRLDPGDGGAPRVGVLTDLLEGSEGEVAAACERALRSLEDSGVRIEPIELGWRGQGLGVALAWEIASLWGERVDAEPDRFSTVIRETVEFGRSRGTAGYEEAIAGIRRARERTRRRVAGLSAVVCPTAPVPAPDRDDESTAVSTRFTRIFNALNWSAFSVPARDDGSGRPIGVQVAAPPSRTGSVIEVARRLEAGEGGNQHT